MRIRGVTSAPKPMLQREKNGTYVVSFVPNEVGILEIRVSARSNITGQLLERSFQAKISNAKAVVPVGGWSRLFNEQGLAEFIPNEETLLELDVSKAGPGQLLSEVLTQFGEVKNHVDVIDDHRLLLRFTPRDSVQHNVNLRWNGKPLAKSPIKLVPANANSQPPNNRREILDYSSNGIANSSQVAGRVKLIGQGLVSAVCGEDNHFTIDGKASNENGHPEVTITGGLKADIPVRLRTVGNNIFAATYSPRTPGTYLLNVLWSGRQVKGCPLKITAESGGKLLFLREDLKKCFYMVLRDVQVYNSKVLIALKMADYVSVSVLLHMYHNF